MSFGRNHVISQGMQYIHIYGYIQYIFKAQDYLVIDVVGWKNGLNLHALAEILLPGRCSVLL